MNDSVKPDAGEILERELPGLQRAVPIGPHCAYRVGGPAEYLFAALRTEDLRHAVVVGRELGLPVTVLGQATNVLVSDRGIRGLVVLARNAATHLDGEVLTAGAGAPACPRSSSALAEQGLAGLEFAANIPGSIGGAVVGNAGAYGARRGRRPGARPRAGRRRGAPRAPTGRTSRSATARAASRAITRPSSLEATLPRSGPAGAARCSTRSPAMPKCGAASTRSSTLRAAATSRTPRASCSPPGSSTRPASKGLRLGLAEVSPAHANFIVRPPRRRRRTTSRRVAAEVRRRVFERFGVRLEEEVVLLGFE